ncbi:MAG TPA: DUF4157 domain-containing protein [Polyangiaceae bacterium]
MPGGRVHAERTKAAASEAAPVRRLGGAERCGCAREDDGEQASPGLVLAANAWAKRGGGNILDRLASQRPPAPSPLQPKIEVGSVNDPLEAEADRIADRVMRAPAAPVVVRAGAEPAVQRACAECEEEAKLQRKGEGGAIEGEAAPPIVHEVLHSPGRRLDDETRAFLEPRFGADFTEVQVHTGAAADASARAVGAKAYTVGSHVVFREGAFAPGTTAGRGLLAHELSHVLQQRRAPATVQRQPGPVPCTLRAPENCPTYEQWIRTFGALPTFVARDTTTAGKSPSGFAVLGDAAAAHTTTGASTPPPPVRPQDADRFIDHPTDTWVQANLPAELRTMAYRLPADCADIAVVLRHVWLFAQGRTETYPDHAGNLWTVGVQAGETDAQRQNRIDDLLVNKVFSGNVQNMVTPYADANGTPLRTFAALAPLLHVGDILVWEHHEGTFQVGHRTGGHTQTIETLTRDANGALQSMTLLQGNQPIFLAQAQEIKKDKSVTDSERKLRDAPGRRIERAALARGADTNDENQIWTQRDPDETTTLVVAGPPRAATRPAAAKGHGRALSDWMGPFRAARSVGELQPAFEAALQEVRATLEGGGTVSDGDARALADEAGKALWRLAKGAHDLGNQSHYEPLYRIRAVIRALGGISPAFTGTTPHAAQVQAAFRALDDQFEMAARGAGAGAIDFTRSAAQPAGTTVLKVLVTGFDPFDAGASSAAPGRARWNPSGAAALALDGTTVNVQPGVVASVEAVVLPVSFNEFAGSGGAEGIVERVIRPLANSVDAVITVSEDGNITQNQVRLEQFSVGTHELGSLSPHRLFPTEVVSTAQSGTPAAIAAAPGGPLGPAILETNAPLATIAKDTADPAAGVNTPAIGPPGTAASPASVTLDFGAAANAAQAAQLLHVAAPAPGDSSLRLPSAAAVQQVIAGATSRDPAHPERLNFQLRNPGAPGAPLVSFTATVVSGPGGSFLSNEVAYRTQRLLPRGTAAGARNPLSFHVHTQGAGGAADPGQTDLRDHTIQTLQRIVRAVGLEIARRAAAQPSTPPAQPSTQPAPPGQKHP